MSRRDPKIFLEDILESIEKIEQYTKGKTEDEFLANFEKQDAIIKKIRNYWRSREKFTVGI